MPTAQKKAPAAKAAKAEKAPKAAKAPAKAKAPKAEKTASSKKEVTVGVVKRTPAYTIWKKRSGRYAVEATNGSWIHAEEKVKILLAEGLIKAPAKKKAEPAPAEA